MKSSKHVHELLPYKAYNRECDLCKTQLDHVMVYACEECSFDLCSKCLADDKDATPSNGTGGYGRRLLQQQLKSLASLPGVDYIDDYHDRASDGPHRQQGDSDDDEDGDGERNGDGENDDEGHGNGDPDNSD
jgi:transcription elongation factor Elf1